MEPHEPALICSLPDALDAQEIEASVFLPFAIRCLQRGDPDAAQATLAVQIRLRDGIERRATLQVHWSARDLPTRPPAIQPHTLIEWGALGTACAVLYALGEGLRLVDVATEGDRFDYWVGDDERMWGLEISGTDSGGLTERQEQKVEQLQQNPWNVDGFVIVVRFASLECRFTFHPVARQRGRV